MSPPTPPLARQLRDATRDAHRALDHHPALQCLLAPTLTREAYAASLLALYPAHATLENRVCQEIARLGLRLRVPRRLSHLTDDLGILGLTPEAPASETAHPPTSPATLAGELYVLEGSRLGGQMIADRLRRTLGPGVPHAFFSLAMAPEEWPRRLAELEALCPPGQSDAALAGAHEAFARFHHQLDTHFRA
ncbi:biliverdin-producing heme oxygenase [Halomonas rhizosphaerae]|uniref:Biliverdin-producing heme oxygenase n=1 Tax=Halomonas rhizosphaerae TaxID=3043296 RepID=A0ABT6V3H2_9GAMM|nr:biliverdin-producing heme oxygenase [Halomonas rhizosphaerae]MDI5892761.1 biliverdin-producing heme oxygenase [Halomonas rhizosphaerae]MDI5922228.1 biliverdin-producing heme oxygenase [Halomonas rhizosphaerae]